MWTDTNPLMNSDLAAQKVMDRLRHADFSALQEKEKVTLVVWQFCAGVSNGGFEGYFKSERSDFAVHAPASLRAIGASALAELARDANSLFGPDGPPADREERRRLLKALPANSRELLEKLDERFFACSEDPDQLLEDHVNRPG